MSKPPNDPAMRGRRWQIDAGYNDGKSFKKLPRRVLSYKNFFSESYKPNIVTLKPSDVLSYKDGSLVVNGKIFHVTDPDESLDWVTGVENNEMVTRFRGRSSIINHWKPEEISGYFDPSDISEDEIKGGLGDDKGVSTFDPKQVAIGIKVEMEHTNDRSVALEIVKDHLTEDPKYYTKLKKCNLEGVSDEVDTQPTQYELYANNAIRILRGIAKAGKRLRDYTPEEKKITNSYIMSIKIGLGKNHPLIQTLDNLKLHAYRYR